MELESIHTCNTVYRFSLTFTFIFAVYEMRWSALRYQRFNFTRYNCEGGPLACRYALHAYRIKIRENRITQRTVPRSGSMRKAVSSNFRVGDFNRYASIHEPSSSSLSTGKAMRPFFTALRLLPGESAVTARMSTSYGGCFEMTTGKASYGDDGPGNDG